MPRMSRLPLSCTVNSWISGGGSGWPGILVRFTVEVLPARAAVTILYPGEASADCTRSLIFMSLVVNFRTLMTWPFTTESTTPT